MCTFRRYDDGKCTHAAFAALLAVALICHQLWWHGFEVDSPRTAIVAAALWLLLAPSSVGRFALLLAVTVGVLAADLPFVMSHLLFVLVVGVTVLVRLAWARLRGPVDAAGAHDALAGFLRAAFLTVYVFAGLAKLNTGFLDPATSCAGPMTADAVWFAPGLLARPELVGPAIVATVVVELALPVLLAIPRTRIVGLVVGGGFHLVLAAAGNVPYTALAFAFYVLFMPPEAARRLVGWFPSGARWAALLIVPLWLGGAALEASDPALAAALVGNGTRLLMLVIAVAGAVALIVGRSAASPPRSRLRSPILVAGLVVLVLNGASPYLGFKTESAQEMFSNLRTEPGTWNHVVVPEAVRLGTLQEPLRVLDGEPSLVARSGGDTRLVRGEVDRVLRAVPGATAVVESDDGTRETLGPYDGPILTDRVAWYRDVTPASIPRC